MSRNLKKEAEWLKNNYKRFEVRVPKEYADDFIEYLKKNNISFNDWCKKRITEELTKKA